MVRTFTLSGTYALVLALIVSATAAAQAPSASENGMESEFGSIRMPTQKDYAGEPVDVEARIVLKNMYAEKDAKFFLFGFSVQTPAVVVDFDSIKIAGGPELRIYKDERAQGSLQPQVMIDIKDMPPPGTEIVMHAKVRTTANGQFQVGALAIAFDYHWNKVRMGNGLEAQLYGYTNVGASGVSGSGVFQGPFQGKGNFVPGVPAALWVPAVVGLAAVIAHRGTRNSRS